MIKTKNSYYLYILFLLISYKIQAGEYFACIQRYREAETLFNTELAKYTYKEQKKEEKIKILSQVLKNLLEANQKTKQSSECSLEHMRLSRLNLDVITIKGIKEIALGLSRGDSEKEAKEEEKITRDYLTRLQEIYPQ